MESLGPKIRKRRRRLGLTLDDLAGRADISKPYLSLIENERVTNPPSDEKLKRLETTLGFADGELLTQAHLQRTPKDVRAMLASLMDRENGRENGHAAVARVAVGAAESNGKGLNGTAIGKSAGGAGLNLDAAYLNGMLHELAERRSSNVEMLKTRAIPIINKVAAGYPKDFTDLSYPPSVADDYVGCPDLSDRDAFAARVFGDSMVPKYREGDIVIFSPAAPCRSGDDCFVRFDTGETTFKRVFFETEKELPPAELRLQPRNEKYPVMTVPGEKITGLYRAMFKYQRLDE